MSEAVAYGSWKDYTEALGEEPTEAEAVRLEAAFQAQADAQGDVDARRPAPAGRAEAVGDRARCYVYTPPGGGPTQRRQLTVRVPPLGPYAQPYDLDGEPLAREAAAWLLHRWRRDRARGGRLERHVYGPGWRVAHPRKVWPLDPHIRPLVRAVDAVPGVTVIGSCGGHEHPGPGQWSAGNWYVKFRANERTRTGRRALDFLRAQQFLGASPEEPYVWVEASNLDWALEGYNGVDPEAFAVRLAAARATGWTHSGEEGGGDG